VGIARRRTSPTAIHPVLAAPAPAPPLPRPVWVPASRELAPSPVCAGGGRRRVGFDTCDTKQSGCPPGAGRQGHGRTKSGHGGGVEVVGAAFEPLHPSAINPIPTTLTCAGRVQRKGRTGGEWPVYQTPSSSRASALRLLLRRVAVPPPHHASCDHTSTSLRSSLVPASPFQIHLRAREEAL
jgi:hypothetical protein